MEIIENQRGNFPLLVGGDTQSFKTLLRHASASRLGSRTLNSKNTLACFLPCSAMMCSPANAVWRRAKMPPPSILDMLLETKRCGIMLAHQPIFIHVHTYTYTACSIILLLPVDNIRQAERIGGDTLRPSEEPPTVKSNKMCVSNMNKANLMYHSIINKRFNFACV